MTLRIADLESSNARLEELLRGAASLSETSQKKSVEQMEQLVEHALIIDGLNTELQDMQRESVEQMEQLRTDHEAGMAEHAVIIDDLNTKLQEIGSRIDVDKCASGVAAVGGGHRRNRCG